MGNARFLLAVIEPLAAPILNPFAPGGVPHQPLPAMRLPDHLEFPPSPVVVSGVHPATWLRQAGGWGEVGNRSEYGGKSKDVPSVLL